MLLGRFKVRLGSPFVGWGINQQDLWPDMGMAVAELETETSVTSFIGKGLMAPG